MKDDDFLRTEREIRQKFAKLLNKKTKHVCLIPNCSDKAISSHSVSRNHLNIIAEDGHLIAPQFDRNKLVSKLAPSDINLSFASVGLKKASVFNGFCREHDNAIFESVDNSGVVTLRDIYLQLYRTACKSFFTHKVLLESEIDVHGSEVYSNSEFENSMDLSLEKIILFFEDILTGFDELDVPINLDYSSCLRQKPWSNKVPLDIEIIYKKVYPRYPVALQKDYILDFNGASHHCLFVLIPHSNFSSLIIACAPEIVPQFGNYISKGDIGILRLVESVFMSDSDFLLARTVFEKWSQAKKQCIIDDFYFFTERDFLEEYDISIFDDIRASLMTQLPHLEHEREFIKINKLPKRLEREARNQEAAIAIFSDMIKRREIGFDVNK